MSSNRPRVRSAHRPTHAISEAELKALWLLYSPHHNVTFTEFKHRLYDKMDYLTRYYDVSSGQLVGMTAVREQVVTLSDGKEYRTLYGGMSYIAPEYRGLRLLPRTMAHYGVRWKVRYPFTRIFTWADVISYRPYIVGARSTRRFYPSRKYSTPADIRELICRVGQMNYGAAFDPETGTVGKESNRLKEHVAPLTATDLQDPDIRFYVEKNTGYAKGDGLICIVPLTWSNIFYSMKQALRKSLRKQMNSVSHQPQAYENHKAPSY